MGLETGRRNLDLTSAKPGTSKLIVAQPYEVGEVLQTIGHGFERVKRRVVGREDVLTQTLFALLTREHQLLYSKPGIAKTQYAQTLFDLFDAPTFEIHATKGTTEEAFVGPIDLTALKAGDIVHKTEGTLVTAKLAHLDELFDANDAALRAIMSILHERTFSKGKQQEQAQLHTAIASTNYLRSTDITDAILDRFLFRAYMLPQTDPHTMLRIDRAYEEIMGDGEKTADKIPFASIEYLADIVEGKVPEREITASYPILFLKNGILTDFARQAQAHAKSQGKKEFYLSPRTVAKTRKILNASALLHGRSEVTKADLDALPYMVCEIGDTEQQAIFDQIKDSYLAISDKDLQIVDTLMGTSDALSQMFTARSQGEIIKTPVIVSLKRIFGLASAGELSFEQIVNKITDLTPDSTKVQMLKISVLAYIDGQNRKFAAAGKASPVLLG